MLFARLTLPWPAGRPAIEGAKPTDQHLLEAGPSTSPGVPASRPWQRQSSEEQAPPPYTPVLAHAPPVVNAKPSSLAAAVAAKSKPPPPKPKPAQFASKKVAETVTALYDYAAQAEGDLSFKAGDTIEIITRTKNDNEWWTGRLNGKEGQFPGESFL